MALPRIFEPPTLRAEDHLVLTEIERLHADLSRFVSYKSRRWYGQLRRMAIARAVRGSNWIEGYRASLDDVLDTIEGNDPLEAPPATRSALEGYRDAMTYILRLSDAGLQVDETLLRSLHFMMTKHDLRASSGLYRNGDVWAEDASGLDVYEAPDADLVEGLMAALVRSVNSLSTTPSLVRAAMAHLNLAMIHPFRDGNGRMARALQTMVLSGAGVASPEFSSIEEYLGRNTDAYYAVLREVGQGSWNPGNSTRPWIRFVLTAHYRQAWIHWRRIRETEALYDSIEQLVAGLRLQPRTVGALADAARGQRIRRSNYMFLIELTTGDPVSELTASRDLKGLVDAGLLEPKGAGRGRIYYGSTELKQRWLEVRATRPPTSDDDPYLTLPQPRLPGVTD